MTSRHLVSEGGLEPPRPFGHQLLKLARLPIPPLRRGSGSSRIGGQSSGHTAAPRQTPPPRQQPPVSHPCSGINAAEARLAFLEKRDPVFDTPDNPRPVR